MDPLERVGMPYSDIGLPGYGDRVLGDEELGLEVDVCSSS